MFISKKWFITIGLLAFAVIMTACGATSSGHQSSQAVGQNITEQYEAAATQSVPYPTAQMKAGGWLERTLLKENLLRQNNVHRLAYVTLLSQQGQPIITFPIQGMVFSLNSQMTPTDRENCHVDGSTSCASESVTASPGDNGTWGPEPDGIGFFTTSGVEIKWNGPYIEADAPLDITTKPLIVYNVNSTPSVSAGGVVSTTKGGIKVTH